MYLTIQACLSATESQKPSVKTNPDLPPEPAIIPSSKPSQVALPTPIAPMVKSDGQLVMLWAVEASTSSSAGEAAYGAAQALGKPNTLVCGDFVTAWQPAAEAFEAWLELDYEPFILPNEIHIAHSYHPGQIKKVEMITVNGEQRTVFDSEQTEMEDVTECPITHVYSPREADNFIRAVRISLQRQPEETWTQIDAVGVQGWVADIPPEAEPTLAPVAEDSEFPQSRYFSNKNLVNHLVVVENHVWSASDGGVVAWDLESLSSDEYTAADGLPANATRALTDCRWDDNLIVAGGVAGVAMISLNGAPTFTPLEHPDDEFLGAVTALGCDSPRQQLWVGYSAHLSRYDAKTQSWEEFGEDAGMPYDVVRQIKIIDEDVWVATANGVAVLRGGKRLESFTPQNSKIPTQFIHAIAADESGTLWMASSDGLIEFNGKSWQTRYASEISDGSLLNVFMGLEPASDGSLWLADTYGSLCHFEPASKKCTQNITPPDDFGSLASLSIDSQGRPLLGSTTHGVWLLDGTEWVHLRTNDQIVDNVLHALACTPDGHLWLAGKTTLQHFQANQPNTPWQTLSLPDDAQPLSLHVTSSGLWIGHTRGARFVPYLTQETLDLPVGDPDRAIANSVTVIRTEPAGRAWFGTSSGLSIWDGQNFQYEDLLTDAERAKKTYPPVVNSINTSENIVWVGASNGLFKFVDGRLTASWRNSLQNISSFNSSSVGLVDSSPDGAGLLVGLGRELFLLRQTQFERLLETPSEIRSLFKAPYAIWLATANSGIYSIPMDNSGIYWYDASGGGGFSMRFGYQATAMSDAYTLWIASREGGLERRSGMFSQ